MEHSIKEILKCCAPVIMSMYSFKNYFTRANFTSVLKFALTKVLSSSAEVMFEISSLFTKLAEILTTFSS